MKYLAILFFISSMIFLAGTLFFESVQSAPKVIEQKPISEDRLFSVVNNWRTENGYQEYEQSDLACSVAEKRLPEVKTNWSHEGFNADRFCVNCSLGENLAKNYPNEEQFLRFWLNSPTHKENLTANYTHSCIMCDSGYCVQIFTYY